MTGPLDRLAAARLMLSLEQIDSEIARLGRLCQIRVIEPGVVERVVRNDVSVCGMDNPVAFEKLRNMLAMHFAVRHAAGVALGQALASRVEQRVIDRVRTRFPSLADGWPPAAH